MFTTPICTMKYHLSLLVLCSTINFIAASVLPNSVEEYYWRDYRGLIPADAIPGGIEHGHNTYIGQINVPMDRSSAATYSMDFIPAVISFGNETIIAPYGGKTIYADLNCNVKILCSQNSRRYVWHTEPSLVENSCRYVVAGQEALVPLYIGRGVYNKQTYFGKIFSDRRNGGLLIVPFEGGEKKLENYSTLMYCY